MNNNVAPDSKFDSNLFTRSHIKWGKKEETDNFAQKVKLYRRHSLSDDDFRRFRLQHGAYGSRLQMGYSMIRIKIPSGEITPDQARKNSRII